MYYSFQTLDDGLDSWVIFLPELQEIEEITNDHDTGTIADSNGFMVTFIYTKNQSENISYPWTI